jgi:hypothetical protein
MLMVLLMSMMPDGLATIEVRRTLKKARKALTSLRYLLRMSVGVPRNLGEVLTCSILLLKSHVFLLHDTFMLRRALLAVAAVLHGIIDQHRDSREVLLRGSRDDPTLSEGLEQELNS